MPSALAAVGTGAHTRVLRVRARVPRNASVASTMRAATATAAATAAVVARRFCAAAAAPSVPAALVKRLREATGAPILECKRALESSERDLAAATDWLRRRGVSVAAKKSARHTACGLVALGVSGDGRRGAMLQLSTETDFVHGAESVQAVARRGVQLLLLEGKGGGGATHERLCEALAADIARAVAHVNENLSVARSTVLDAGSGDGGGGRGRVGAYLHNNAQIGALVALSRETPLARSIAMHVAAMNPPYLSRDRVESEVVRREREALAAQLEGSGKPAHLVDRIVDGRMSKFYASTCLLEQALVTDSAEQQQQQQRSVQRALPQGTAIVDYVRYSVHDVAAASSSPASSPSTTSSPLSSVSSASP